MKKDKSKFSIRKPSKTFLLNGGNSNELKRQSCSRMGRGLGNKEIIMHETNSVQELEDNHRQWHLKKQKEVYASCNSAHFTPIQVLDKLLSLIRHIFLIVCVYTINQLHVTIIMNSDSSLICHLSKCLRSTGRGRTWCAIPAFK